MRTYPWTVNRMIQLAALLMSLLFIGNKSVAATWVVNSLGGGDRPTLQAAINAAGDGDSVLVSPGTYRGEGNRDITFLGKAIALIGTSGPAATVIDCEGGPGDPHRGFYLRDGENGDALIQGLTVTNGYAEGERPDNFAGGILLIGASPTIRDVWLVHNRTAHFGGGMVCYQHSSPILQNLIFLENEAANNGGGLGVEAWSNPLISQTLFVRNRARRGGGSWVWNESEPHFVRVTFYGNDASDFGGGIWCNQSEVWITQSILASSTSGEGFTCSPFGIPPIAHMSCTDIFGNAGGDSIPDCVVDGEGNFSIDPLFCNPLGDDFSLLEGSPCQPGHHPTGDPCGWIGARDGCGLSGLPGDAPRVRRSWGSVRHMFR